MFVTVSQGRRFVLSVVVTCRRRGSRCAVNIVPSGFNRPTKCNIYDLIHTKPHPHPWTISIRPATPQSQESIAVFKEHTIKSHFFLTKHANYDHEK